MDKANKKLEPWSEREASFQRHSAARAQQDKIDTAYRLGISAGREQVEAELEAKRVKERQEGVAGMVDELTRRAQRRESSVMTPKPAGRGPTGLARGIERRSLT
jgi:hypothetical protein